MQACLKISQKPEELCHLIQKAINNQPRKRKGSKSPIDLMRMNHREVNKLNREYPNKQKHTQNEEGGKQTRGTPEPDKFTYIFKRPEKQIRINFKYNFRNYRVFPKFSK